MIWKTTKLLCIAFKAWMAQDSVAFHWLWKSGGLLPGHASSHFPPLNQWAINWLCHFFSNRACCGKLRRTTNYSLQTKRIKLFWSSCWLWKRGSMSGSVSFSDSSDTLLDFFLFFVTFFLQEHDMENYGETNHSVSIEKIQLISSNDWLIKQGSIFANDSTHFPIYHV